MPTPGEALGRVTRGREPRIHRGVGDYKRIEYLCQAMFYYSAVRPFDEPAVQLALLTFRAAIGLPLDNLANLDMPFLLGDRTVAASYHAKPSMARSTFKKRNGPREGDDSPAASFSATSYTNESGRLDTVRTFSGWHSRLGSRAATTDRWRKASFRLNLRLLLLSVWLIVSFARGKPLWPLARPVFLRDRIGP
jgi:hypothetical protein